MNGCQSAKIFVVFIDTTVHLNTVSSLLNSLIQFPEAAEAGLCY